MEWSRKAWFVVIVYILAALILSGITISIPEMGYSTALVLFIVFVLSGTLSAFDVNCVEIGGCTKFSWLKTFLYTVNPILIIIAAIVMYKQNKDQ